MLFRVEIFNYRRLQDVSAYVGRKTVALVGPNEAGKSSILSALKLFDNDDRVPETDTTRSLRGETLDPKRVVVRLSFTLDEAQHALASQLPIFSDRLRHIIFTKVASGKRAFHFDPQPEVLPTIHGEFKKAWPTLSKQLERFFAESTDEPGFTLDEVNQISAFLTDAGESPPSDIWGRIGKSLDDRLGDSERFTKKLEAFKTFHQWGRPGVDISGMVFRSISASFPRFVKFDGQLRSIKSEYVIDEADTESSAALENLLRLAKLPLSTIRKHRSEPSHLRTLIDKANERLEEFFTARWKQEQITVGLDVDGPVLRVDVRDLSQDSTGWIEITERSDGLKTFVALAAFLDAVDPDTPPILLIDEAEQHLHLNAQIDLMRMLQGMSGVQQIIYTTHSPACLPTDLGSGVRFVEPIENGHSRIRHDFWSIDREEHVGFNPLLIVMGAGASAFSGLRSALVGEGVSEMLLLPTLIKIATQESELSYQVSPGIATSSKADMSKLDFVASRVAYVVDGDVSGDDWRRQLEESGVPKSRIRSLPDGKCLEDLFDRDFYLDSIASLGRISRKSLHDIEANVPIKNAVAKIKSRRSLPGSIAFAEYVLGRHESGLAPIKLDPQMSRVLRELHAWVRRTVGD